MRKGRPSALAMNAKWPFGCQERLGELVTNAKQYLAHLDITQRVYDKTLVRDKVGWKRAEHLGASETESMKQFVPKGLKKFQTGGLASPSAHLFTIQVWIKCESMPMFVFSIPALFSSGNVFVSNFIIYCRSSSPIPLPPFPTVCQCPAEQHVSVFLSDAPVFLLTFVSTLTSSLCRLCRSMLSLPPILPPFWMLHIARGISLTLENNHTLFLETRHKIVRHQQLLESPLLYYFLTFYVQK